MIAESFVFVPFKLKDPADFHAICADRQKMESAGWLLDGMPPGAKETKKNRYTNYYLLKYVAERVNSTDIENRQCFHYLLDRSRRPELFGEDKIFLVKTKASEEFRFEDVHLYFFSTGIGMLAFFLSFPDTDARKMADTLYHIKRANHRDLQSADGSRKRFSIRELSESLTDALRSTHPWKFFFYTVEKGSCHCNCLSLFETVADAGGGGAEIGSACREQLYFLRNNYGYGFGYMEDPAADSREVFRTTADRLWGVTAEGAVCVAPVSPGSSASFTEGTFHDNFKTHYLFMFVLALHQKYVLYDFLTEMSVKIRERTETLEELEDYRNRLYWFEKDFSFAVVTEVPQYQIVYERLRMAFNLEKMYDDVHEPLVSLSEMKKEAEDKQDRKVGVTLNIISVLAVFSALVDSFDLLREIFYGDSMEPLWHISYPQIRVLLLADLAAIIVIVLCAFFGSHLKCGKKKGNVTRERKKEPHEK